MNRIGLTLAFTALSIACLAFIAGVVSLALEIFPLYLQLFTFGGALAIAYIAWSFFADV